MADNTIRATFRIYNTWLCPYTSPGNCKNYPAVGAQCKVLGISDETLATGLTDSSGRVSFQLPSSAGAYTLVIAMPGYTIMGSNMMSFAASENVTKDVFIAAKSAAFAPERSTWAPGQGLVYHPAINPPPTGVTSTQPSSSTPTQPSSSTPTTQPTAATPGSPTGGTGGLPKVNKKYLVLIGGALALFFLTRKG